MKHESMLGMHFHWCGRSQAARHGQAWRLLRSEVFTPFYDLTTDEEANDCVCVLAKARYPCR